MKLAPHPTTMSSMLCKLYIVLLAVVAIAVSEIELTKTQCLEMNFMIVVFATMIFLGGVGVGVVSMYVTKVRVSKVTATTAKVTKVKAYPTGRRYHCFTCTSTSFTSNDRLHRPKEITIEQAEEQRLTPCKCKACDKTWKVL